MRVTGMVLTVTAGAGLGTLTAILEALTVALETLALFAVARHGWVPSLEWCLLKGLL